MRMSSVRRHPTPRRPKQKTAMNQVGFDDILERPLILANRGREGLEPDRTASELLDQGREHGSVKTVEALLVDVESAERIMSGVEANAFVRPVPNRREVPHPTQKPIRNARRAPRPTRDLVRRLWLEFDVEESARARHDLFEILDRVILESSRPTEAVAQRRRQETRARRRPDQCKFWQVEPNRASRRALADQEIELEIFHRRIEDLFDGGREAMYLIDEEHVASFEIRQ